MGDELTDLSEDLRYRNVMAIRRTKAGERKVELQVWSIACEQCQYRQCSESESALVGTDERD